MYSLNSHENPMRYFYSFEVDSIIILILILILQMMKQKPSKQLSHAVKIET